MKRQVTPRDTANLEHSTDIAKAFKTRFVIALVISFITIFAATVNVLMKSGVAKADVASRSQVSTQIGRQVVVFRDYTPSANCTLHTSKSGQTITCPAGTILEQTVVSLAEAQANHEQYVVLPPKNGSAREFQFFETQLQQLENSVQKKYHSVTSQAVQRLNATGCGQSNYWDASWNVPGSSFSSEIGIYRDTSCNMQIEYSAIGATWITNFYYWDHDQYAGWNEHWGCRQITNSVDFEWPYVYQPSGYWYQQIVSSGANCTPWDSYYHVNIGPLS